MKKFKRLFKANKKEQMVRCKRCSHVFSIQVNPTCPSCREEGYNILIYDNILDGIAVQ